MMIVTLSKFGKKRGRPIRLLGTRTGLSPISYVSRDARGSVLSAIEEAGRRFKTRHEFLFLAPGASVDVPNLTIRDHAMLRPFEVAAYVDRIGTPELPAPFDGIGRIDIRTLYIRTGSDAVLRLFERWRERAAEVGRTQAEALMLALSEIREVRFLHLPPTYSWVEREMRALHPNARPIIVHDDVTVPDEPAMPKAAKQEPTPEHRPRAPEVLWAGHLYDYSGYGKANREILFRVANSLNVRLDTTHKEPILVDEYTRARVDAFKETIVGDRCPVLRFFGPDFQADRNGRHRICWTMMETYRAHPAMVALLNENFDEVWTPTEWNRRVFVESGVRIETRSVPLGVNTLVYRRFQKKPTLPPCRLLSTARAGTVAVPDGFVFLSVGLPSFRKGFDAIADAMERTLARKPDAHLVMAITHSLPDWNQKVYQQFARYKARIWALEGRFNEHEMARIYAASDCYVSASRGEGWNLPVCEAAACGIPVICPDNTSHPEVVGRDAFMFHCEPPARCPEVEQVSDWYKEMPFSKIGRESVEELAEILAAVYAGSPEARRKASALHARMLMNLTWDAAAEAVAYRLTGVQS